MKQGYYSFFFFNWLVSLSGLVDVPRNILPLQRPHALDLIKIDNKAVFIRVNLLDALSAEHSQMLTAVKVLHSFWMGLTELLVHELFIIVFKVKVAVGQLLVLFDYFVEDVDVKREVLGGIELLDKLAA